MTIHPYFVCDGHFPSINNYQVFICTGSKHSVYENLPWIRKLRECIRNIYLSEKKFIGICFGHQMIAQALGGKVKRSQEGYLIGLHTFKILKRKLWMEPYEAAYKVLMLCQDQVVSLPASGEILASSSECPIGMYTVGDHFLGIQGHPEFTRGYNRSLFESRLEKTEFEKLQQAILSLEDKPENEKLASYLNYFMNG